MHNTPSDAVAEERNSFEVQLSRWRNQVNFFTIKEAKTGFICTIRLDRLGFVKIFQRRLGLNYQVLHVNGNEDFIP